MQLPITSFDTQSKRFETFSTWVLWLINIITPAFKQIVLCLCFYLLCEDKLCLSVCLFCIIVGPDTCLFAHIPH